MLNKEEFAPKQRRRQQPAHDTGGDVPRPHPRASLAPQSPAPAAAARCIIIVVAAEHLFDIIILLLLPARSQSHAWIPGRLHPLGFFLRAAAPGARLKKGAGSILCEHRVVAHARGASAGAFGTARFFASADDALASRALL